MRQSYGSFWSVTTGLIAANVAFFVVQKLLVGLTTLPVNDYLALSVQGMQHGHVWQLLTFQFMHAGVIHLLLNCVGLYFFGRDLEIALGRKSFLTLYLTSGIIGGLLQVGAGAIAMHFPNVIWGHQFIGPTVGASAGVSGLIAAYAMLAPNREFHLLAFFVLPVRIRAWYLLAFVLIVDLIGIAIPKGNVANAAHLGGILAGVIFVRYAIYWQWPERRRSPAPLPRKLVKVHPGSSALWDKNELSEHDVELPPAEFLSREVDPILEKISAHGIQSLTEHERRVLESARQKIDRR